LYDCDDREKTGTVISPGIRLIHTGPAPVVPVNAGLAKNSLGVSVNDKHPSAIHVTATNATAPVTGINGTTMGHHPGVGGIGGPAKERSAIGGSAFHK
jgi:hypothetical protein